MTILIVEDDLSLSDVLSFTLRRAGFVVATAFDGLEALNQWRALQPELIILDLNLPKLDGIGVCKEIRASAGTPILILSVRNSDEAVVQGLDAGADDYVIKPFSPNQLIARVRALLRRAGTAAMPGQLTSGRLALDRSRSEFVNGDGVTVRLTGLELRLMETLFLHAGQVLTADALIGAVWGIDGGDRAMLKQLVYRLRIKLEAEAPGAIQIEAVPGIGYALVEVAR
jgi:DNA-binding response OmpR family regulator